MELWDWRVHDNLEFNVTDLKSWKTISNSFLSVLTQGLNLCRYFYSVENFIRKHPVWNLMDHIYILTPWNLFQNVCLFHLMFCINLFDFFHELQFFFFFSLENRCHFFYPLWIPGLSQKVRNQTFSYNPWITDFITVHWNIAMMFSVQWLQCQHQIWWSVLGFSPFLLPFLFWVHRSPRQRVTWGLRNCSFFMNSSITYPKTTLSITRHPKLTRIFSCLNWYKRFN